MPSSVKITKMGLRVMTLQKVINTTLAQFHMDAGDIKGVSYL